MSPAKVGKEFLKYFQKDSIGGISSKGNVKELPISIQLINKNEADEIFGKYNLKELSEVTKRSDVEGDISLGPKVNKGQVIPNTNYQDSPSVAAEMCKPVEIML